MAVSPEDIAFAMELFSGLGKLSNRKMMGGLTIYHDGQIFAILDADGRVYIRTMGPLDIEMAAIGCEKFSMMRKDGTVTTMGYRVMPESALDDPEQACEWAQKSLAEA